MDSTVVEGELASSLPLQLPLEQEERVFTNLEKDSKDKRTEALPTAMLKHIEVVRVSLQGDREEDLLVLT